MTTERIVILGIGCMLYADQGFGVHVVQAMAHRYDLPDHVQLVDGGLIGVSLTGLVAGASHLIAVDAIPLNGRPGEIYRLEGRQVLERLAVKNQIQQVEFLEALAHCQALDHPPKVVLLAVEPEDTRTLACELTPVLQQALDSMIARVLSELDRLGVDYHPKGTGAACA
jgi:hydrogenase maturation protease